MGKDIVSKIAPFILLPTLIIPPIGCVGQTQAQKRTYIAEQVLNSNPLINLVNEEVVKRAYDLCFENHPFYDIKEKEAVKTMKIYDLTGDGLNLGDIVAFYSQKEVILVRKQFENEEEVSKLKKLLEISEKVNNTVTP